MREPEVVTGARETRFEAVQAAEVASAARASSAKPIPEGKVIFQFIATRYQLQLSSGVEERAANGRVIIKERPIKVVADNGFVTLDKVKDAKTIEWIREHQDYGVQFWDYSEFMAKARETQAKQAVETLLAMGPEVKQKLIEALQASGKDTLGLPARNEKATKS